MSKGACLTRFYELFESVLLFFEEEDPTLRDYLRSRETDIAYLADVYFKFNEMNAQLQKDELSLIRSKSIISAFMSKLVLYKQNLSRGELGQFPNLNKAKLNDILKDSDIDAYCDHLQMLHDDFQRRFHDLLSMAVPSWVFDPFKNAADAELHLQEELIDLQSNDELKPRMAQGYDQFWLQKQVPSLYPSLWSVVKTLLISLPSSSLVERCFSVVADLLTKKRNRLQIVSRGDLRLRVTTMEPDIENLLRSHVHD